MSILTKLWSSRNPILQSKALRYRANVSVLYISKRLEFKFLIQFITIIVMFFMPNINYLNNAKNKTRAT